MNQPKASPELLDALREFQNAALKLSNEWARNEVPERFGDAGYADVFDCSFDDWCARLEDWVAQTIAGPLPVVEPREERRLFAFEAFEMPEEIAQDSIGCASHGFDANGACLTCGCLKQCHAPPDDVLADAWKTFRVTAVLDGWEEAEPDRQISVEPWPTGGFYAVFYGSQRRGEPRIELHSEPRDGVAPTREAARAAAAKAIEAGKV
jgi:hypothetical protein